MEGRRFNGAPLTVIFRVVTPHELANNLKISTIRTLLSPEGTKKDFVPMRWNTTSNDSLPEMGIRRFTLWHRYLVIQGTVHTVVKCRIGH